MGIRRAGMGLALVAGLALCSTWTWASEPPIVIDGTSGPAGDGVVNSAVHGNGTPPDGTPPAASPNSATGHSVVVKDGGTVTGLVAGGLATNATGDATVAGNTVTVSGGSVSGSIYGGITSSGRTTCSATGNAVIISGGMVSSVYGGYANAYGGASGHKVTDNTVSISGGTINNGNVYGGRATNSGDVTDNTVSISGGTISGAGLTGNVYGGYSAGVGLGGVATGNTVNISGGTISGSVHGGYIANYGDAAGNTVSISGGTISGNVYGGYADGSIIPANSNSGDATGNTVSISGSPIFGATSVLYGGISAGTASVGDAFTGNTLNLHSAVTVQSAQNFENWNFYLPSTLANGGTMLTVTGTADLGTGAKVNVGIDGASSPLQVGHEIILIDAGTLNGSLSNNTANGQGMLGVTLLYDFDITVDAANNLLLATVSAFDPGPGPGPGRINPQTKALSEGFLGGLTLLNHGSDAIAWKGMGWAKGAAEQTGSGFGAFGGISGGKSRHKTGSHVDMSSFSLMAGLAMNRDILTLGAFFEFGTGSYDTFNSFATAASVRGDGRAHNIGGGVLGRMDFPETGSGRFYTEGSFRAGGVRNKFWSDDMVAGGVRAEYRSRSTYLGTHFGTGYLWNINEQASLDFGAKYFWTRQGSDSVTLSTGELVRFSAANSHRLRVGPRFAYAVNEKVSPYVGVAFEREFSGKARATTNGLPIAVPSLRGNTGVGELGLTITPCAARPVTIDLGVQGYVGKREGVTGSLRVGFAF